jgi:hypothetical protein
VFPFPVETGPVCQALRPWCSRFPFIVCYLTLPDLFPHAPRFVNFLPLFLECAKMYRTDECQPAEGVLRRSKTLVFYISSIDLLFFRFIDRFYF